MALKNSVLNKLHNYYRVGHVVFVQKERSKPLDYRIEPHKRARKVTRSSDNYIN